MDISLCSLSKFSLQVSCTYSRCTSPYLANISIRQKSCRLHFFLSDCAAHSYMCNVRSSSPPSSVQALKSARPSGWARFGIFAIFLDV